MENITNTILPSTAHHQHSALSCHVHQAVSWTIHRSSPLPSPVQVNSVPPLKLFKLATLILMEENHRAEVCNMLQESFNEAEQ